MVEKTPVLDALTYAFLMVGIVIVGFPIIYALIAATLPIEEVSRVPMPLIPGDQFWVNMAAAWEKGLVRWYREREVGLPMVIDVPDSSAHLSSRSCGRYGVRSLPCDVLIDRTGTIRVICEYDNADPGKDRSFLIDDWRRVAGQ